MFVLQFGNPLREELEVHISGSRLFSSTQRHGAWWELSPGQLGALPLTLTWQDLLRLLVVGTELDETNRPGWLAGLAQRYMYALDRDASTGTVCQICCFPSTTAQAAGAPCSSIFHCAGRWPMRDVRLCLWLQRPLAFVEPLALWRTSISNHPINFLLQQICGLQSQNGGARFFFSV